MATTRRRQITYTVEKRTQKPIGRIDVFFYILVLVFVTTLVTTHVLLGVYAI